METVYDSKVASAFDWQARRHPIRMSFAMFAALVSSGAWWHPVEAAESEQVHVYQNNGIRFAFSDQDAKRVHVLLACDIDAAGIGDTVKTDLRRLREYFLAVGGMFQDVQFNVQALYGPSLTPDGIKTYYDDLKTTPDDVLFFYYSGHGASDTSQVIGQPPGKLLMESQYLNLKRGKIFRSAIRSTMERKPHKLVVMLTDCCSNRDKIVLPGKGIGDGALYKIVGVSSPEQPDTFSEKAFRGLFLRCGGIVDFSAASLPTFTVNGGKVVEVAEGETAVCNDQVGGIFTHVLLRLLALPPTELSKGSRYPKSEFVDWMQLFGKLQPGTYNYRIGLDGSVLTGIDRNNHDAVAQKLKQFGAIVNERGSQRPFFFEMRGE